MPVPRCERCGWQVQPVGGCAPWCPDNDTHDVEHVADADDGLTLTEFPPGCWSRTHLYAEMSSAPDGGAA